MTMDNANAIDITGIVDHYDDNNQMEVYEELGKILQERNHYREALERIAAGHPVPINIATEALAIPGNKE